MVAIILFGIAGTLSIREGYNKFLHPEPIHRIGLAYLAIAVGVIFETYVFRIAIRNIKREMRDEQYKNLIEAIKHSKDPTTITVLVEDSLALAGLFVAAVAITIVHFTGILVIDAVASIVIGVLLMVFALFLAFETKNLLLGEAVTPLKRRKILTTVNSFNEIEKTRNEFDKEFKKVSDEIDARSLKSSDALNKLEALRVKYVGRKGLVNQYYKRIHEISRNEIPKYGSELQDLEHLNKAVR